MYKLCFPRILSIGTSHLLPPPPASFPAPNICCPTPISLFLSFFTSVNHRPSRLLEEDVVQRRNNRQPNNRPPSPDNLLVGETDTDIPQQVPHAVERVEEHGEREEALQRHLGSRGPRRDGRNHRGGLKVPSGVGRGQVCETEEVQRARERDARDAVERGRVPGDLRAVDGQVGRDGAVQALLAEDLLRGVLRGGFCCGEPGRDCQWAVQSGWCRDSVAGPGRVAAAAGILA